VLEAGETKIASGGETGSQVQRGSRPVKEYYIHDSELRELKKTGAIATALYALGSAALGFAVNVHTGMAFAEKIASTVKAEWTVYRNLALAIAAICYLIATIQALGGYNRVEQIKAETSHGSEKYVPKPWYKVALWALIIIGAGAGGALLHGALWP
jgi:hypothetical protein